MAKLLPRPNAQLAEETVSRFLTALKTSDVDQMLSATDVPFLLDGRVIGESADLRAQLEGLLQDSDSLSQLTFELSETIDFQSLQQKGVGGEVGKFVQQHLGPRDQMVVADIQIPGKRLDRHAFHVRLRKGRANIIAMLDAPAPTSDEGGK
jgi:hypothetical protein